MMKSLQFIVRLLVSWLMLLALPAWLLVACSGSSTQQQEAARKKPTSSKTALSIIDQFSREAPEIRSVHEVASRRLGPTEFAEMEKMLADVHSRKDPLLTRANVALEGLQLSVTLLPVQKSDATRYWKRLRNIREISNFYGPELIRKLRRTGDGMELAAEADFNLDLAGPANQIEKLEYSIEILSNAAKGAGLQLGKAAELSDVQRNIAAQIDERVKLVSSNVFSIIFPKAREATQSVQQEGSVEQTMAERLSLNITMQAFAVARLVTDGMDNGTMNSQQATVAVDNWVKTILASVKASPVDAIAATDTASVIPTEIPTLDSRTGRYNGNMDSWNFVVDLAPTSGAIDLNQNPPTYIPSENFLQSDRFSFKLCHKDFKSVCSAAFVSTIVRPLMMDVVDLEVAGRGLLPNTSATCRVGPQETRPLLFSWFSKAPALDAPIVRLIDETQNTLTNKSIPRGTAVWCEARVVGPLNLLSPPLPSLPTLVPNAWPIITTAAATAISVLEDVSIEIPLGVAYDHESDPLLWKIVTPPTRGRIIGAEQSLASPAQGNVTYQSNPDVYGPDEFYYKICDNQFPAGCSETLRMSVNVNSVNDSPTAIQLSSDTVLENNFAGTPIGILTTSDADPTDTFIYTVSGEHAEFLRVDGNVLKMTKPVNFETHPQLNADITTTDSGGLSFTRAITIQVLNVNEAPFDIHLSSTSIAENKPIHSLLGNLTTDDPDAFSLFSYTLSGPDAAHFQIFGSMLVTKTIFNFENRNTYEIVITSRDSAGLEYSKIFIINIENVNEVPTDVSLTNQTIAENSAIGTTVGVLSLVDEDNQDTAEFSLFGTDAQYFALNSSGNTAYLVSAAAFDFEQKNKFYVTVRGTDFAGNFTEKQFTLSVTNINEPPVIQTNSVTLSVNEEGTLQIPLRGAVDPDAGRVLRYEISSAQHGLLGTVVGDAAVGGLVSYTSSLNYFGNDGLNYRVCDQFNLCTPNVEVLIQVQPVNDPPYFLTTVANQSVDEDTPLGPIQFNINDIDSEVTCENLTATSSVSTLIPNDADHIIISGGQSKTCGITLIPLLDKNSVNSGGTAEIILRLTDSQVTVPQAFAVYVNPVNDAPRDISLTNQSLAEGNLAYAPVGQLSSVDPDLNNIFSYTLSGPSASYFSISGNILQAALPLNFETAQSHQITVTSTDQSGASYGKTFFINVIDVNEAPTDIALSGLSLAENSPANTVIGTLSTTDQDADENYRYTIGGPDADKFQLVGNSLLSNQPFNFEERSTYSIAIRAEDKGSLSFTKSFTITILDVNEAPENIVLTNTVVPENSSMNIVVGSVSTSDPDIGGSFSYSVGGADAAAFAISGTDLVLKTALDYESKSAYQIVLSTTDNGGASYSKNFTIQVSNVNENPTDLNLSTAVIAENMPIGSLVGTLSAIDPDSGSIFTYAISGTDASLFAINGNNLVTNATFDFENRSTYSIVLTVYDQGPLPFSKLFVISVSDVNEAPTDVSLSAAVIAENTVANSLIGNLSTSDPDQIDEFTYSLSGPDAGSFILSGGKLYSAEVFSFESKNQYNISLTSTDKGSQSITKNFVVSVLNANESPTGITLSGNVISEDSAVNTLVGLLSSQDPDAGDTFTYTLSGSDSAAFTVVGQQLRTNATFNFESKQQYVFTVTTTDSGGAQFAQEFTVVITNVNEVPTSISLSSNSVPENAPVGTIVGALTTSDPDASNTFVYTLSGADASAFAIAGSNLVTDASFDFETKSIYSITVQSQDQGGLWTTANFTINVSNVNEAPVNISLSQTSVNENNAIGAVVANISTNDPDSSSSFTYAISGLDWASFSVIGSDLLASASFNYETKSSYSIILTTTDQGGLSYSKSFVITINDLNEAPSDIVLGANSIGELAPLGTIIGALNTVDPDSGNTFTYTLGGADGSAFVIQSQMLKTNALFDYELKSTYAVTVTSTDQNGAQITKPFIISILNENEPPTNITLSNMSIAENSSVGSFVASASTSDPDSGSTFNYLLGGPDAASFVLSGNNISTAASLDFESKSSYSITVTSQDQGGLQLTTGFVIGVTNVNESPTNITLTSTSITENSPVGTQIGTLSTSDVDAGNSFTYLLSGPDSAYFTLTGNTLSSSQVFNYEIKLSYEITIRTTDQDGLWFEKPFVITVLNQNEAPTAVMLSGQVVNENASVGTLVGTFAATDPDTGSTFTYTVGGSDAAAFSVSGNSLSTSQSFNFESKSQYVVTITCTDQGGLSFNQDFTISVLDINEAPTAINLANLSVPENAMVGTLVGAISTVDPDAANSFTYALSGPDSAAFQIVGSLLKSNSVFDYESKDSYSITITSTDQNNAQISQPFVIAVNNVNEAPLNINFAGSAIAENNAIGAVLGTFSTVDPDIGNTHTYSLSGADASAFLLSGSSLSAAISFNYEVKTTYTFTITSQDQNGLSYTKNFVINVTNQNEPPVNINITAATVAENQNVGTLVGYLSSEDPDQANTFTYTVGGIDGASFYIAGNALRTAASFNYEAVQSYSITITSTDQGGQQFVKGFTINSSNVNETPIDFSLSANSVAENNSLNDLIGTMTTVDPDASNTFTYSISGADAAAFSIVGNELRAAVQFDYESKSTYSFSMTTQDQGGLSFTKSVVISITNVNEYPTNILLSNNAINENLPSGTEIGLLSSIDPDFSSTFTYTISGTDAASFSISGNILRSAQSFNFESKSTYLFTITTQDQGGLTFSKDFAVTINDINESPTNIALSNNLIPENVANGTPIATLTTSDPDAANTFTYSLSGTDAFAFNIVSGVLVTATPLNFESKNSYSFSLTSTDQGGLQVTLPFVVSVTNVNEAPDDISLSVSTIAENSAANSTVGSFSTSDVDASNTFTYSLSGPDAASFSVTGAQLKALNSFNFENKSSYSIIVTSTDQGGLSFSKSFTISVIDVNESPFDIALTANSIPENQPVSTLVANLSTSDPDSANTFTYTVGGVDGASFAISGETLVTAASFNFEVKNSYAISITTQDQNNLSYTKNFTISVINVNETPTDITLSATSIAEINALGATVATLSTTDVDAGNTFTYTLGGTDAAAFAISGSTLTAATVFDFESKPSYSITLTSTDQGGLAFTKPFTISITNVNEQPNDIAMSANSFAENQSAGTLVANLSTTDPDASNTFSYTVSGTDAASFTISGNQLLSAASFNFESKSSYSFNLTTQDQGGLSYTKAFTVNITNVNEQPTNITLSATSIAENNAVNAVVAALSTTDPDFSNTFTYTLSGTDAASFAISGASLLAVVSFDYETKSSYSLNVITTDQGGLSYTKAVVISVTNVNETPTNITLSSLSINENLSVGSTIGTLTTADVDSGNTFTYGLGGTDASAFSISGASLQSAMSFNFEAKSSYSISITTTDQGGLSYTKNFTITINDVNETPTDVTLSNTSVAENVALGTVVGTLGSADPDGGNSFSYSVGGADAAAFTVSAGMLVTNAALDFETKNIYSITLTTTDQGSLSFTKAFVIAITNVNESPTNITLSAASIAENNAIAATIGTLTTTDVDASNTFTYGLSGTDAASFSIVGNALKAAVSFDFETKSSYAFSVTTTDQGGLSYTKAFTVSITNVNETPTDISMSSSSVPENAASGTVVGTLTTADPDASNTFSYSIGGADAASFSVSGNTVSTAASFNFESKSSYSITITTVDQGNLQFTKSFTISVTNVNETPTNITLSTASINENNALNAVIGTLSTTDPDASNTFSYAVSGTDAASFSVSGNSLLAAISFNYEAKSSYSISITTTDQGGLTFTKAFTISILNINDAPTSISLSATSIAENNAVNATIGTISGVDPDALDSLSFTISGGADSASFNISGTTLRASASFDFETKSSYSVTLRATDTSGATLDVPFTISITNVNEAPITTGGDSSKTTSEDTPVSIALASASDPDAGNTMSYLILNPSSGTLGTVSGNPSAGGSISYTPNLNFNGSDSFSYSVCDNLNLCSASRTVTLAVTAVNDSPTITSVSNQTINEDTPSSALSFTIADVDSTVSCSQVTATSSITTLIPNGNLVIAGGSGTACTITVTPAADRNNVSDPGTETVTLSLADSSGATATRSFTVTVTPVNDAPTMNAISAQTVNMNNALAVGFTVGDVDGALACSATHLSYSSSTPAIVAATGAVAWSGTWPNCVGTITPVSSAFGVLNVTFQVTDSASASANRTFQLTVRDTRAATAPTISGSSSVTSNVTNFVLSGTCTSGYTVDLSGDVSVSQMVTPFQSLTQTCLSNGTYSFTIGQPLDGQYVFRVAQTNPFQVPSPIQSASVSTIWTRDTVVPSAVTLSSPVDNPTSSRSGTFTFLGSCEASATVNMSATVVPSSIVVAPLSTTCSASGTFSFSQNLGTEGSTASDGTYTYTLTQTDPAGNVSAALSFVWTKDSSIPTTPVMSAPTVNASRIYYTNSATSTTYPTITVSCTYNSVVASNNSVTIVENGNELVSAAACTSPNTYSYSSSAHVDGTYNYSIYQTNPANSLNSAATSFTWIRDTVAPAAPVITNPSTSSITTPSSLYISGTCETNATVEIYVGGVLESAASVTCLSGKFATSIARVGSTANYSVTAKQKDPAGNTSAATAAKTWTQDPYSIPVPVVTFPSGGTLVNNASTLNIIGLCQPNNLITISAGASTTLVSSDITSPAGAFTQICASDGTFAISVGKNSDATYNFNIIQQITSGGTASVPATVTWTRDTVAPTVTITANGVNGFTANPLFTLAASEANVTYTCSTDNVTYSTCASPYVHSLATSTNPKTAHNIAKTLYVKAKDLAQNTGAAASTTWTPTVNFASLLFNFDNTLANSSSYTVSALSTADSTPYSTTRKFGTHSLSLGTSNPSTLADNNILASFLSTATIEFWLLTNSSNSSKLVTQQVSATSGFSWSINTSKVSATAYNITFSGSTDGTTLQTISTACNLTKSNSVWQHIAVTFERGSVVIYCNGTNAGSGTIGTAGSARLFDSTGSFVIGGSVAFSMDELRISQGVRYTGNFTVPAAAFTAD